MMEHFYPITKTEQSPHDRVLDVSKNRLVSDLGVSESIEDHAIKPFGTITDDHKVDLSQTAILTEIQ